MKKIIIAIIFLSSIFGCKQNTNNVYPKEEFFILDTKLTDGKPALGSFNLGYQNYEHKSQYPWCLKIAIALDLKNCMDNGLPHPEELSLANKLENELLENIKGITTSHYVGHLFNDTFLDIYIYLDNPKKVHEWLQTQVNKENLIRGFGYEIKEDPKWNIVKEFIGINTTLPK